MSAIKFGTDGWRARMGDQFTFENVRLFAQSYALHLKEKKKHRDLKVIINYDTRLLSRRFAEEAAKVLSLNGIRIFLTHRDSPIPPVALAIVQHKLDGGLNFTASFNKPIFNGVKVFTSRGVSALPSETCQIEKFADTIHDSFYFKPQYANEELISEIDIRDDYVQYLEKLVNFDLIRDSNMKIIVDNLHGTSRNYLDYILSKNNVEMIAIRNFPSSSFENIIATCNQGNLRELSRLVATEKAHIGLATDIDGDRFGIIDARGHFLNSNTIMPPLIEYLIQVRKMEGGIVKSISTTNTISRVAEHYSREVFITPVGFKYLANVMANKHSFVAVESTNGASLNHKITIKDGILFNLLITEMLAWHKLDMEKLLANFYNRFPKYANLEANVKKNPRSEEHFQRLLTQKKFDFPGFKLIRKEYIDGIKFIFENAWLLIRFSGTDRFIRIYAESPILSATRNLIKAGRSFIE